jgi:hypothetical protein
VDRHALINLVVVAYLNPRDRAPVRQILRLAANRDVRTDEIIFAEPDRAHQTNMPNQAGSASDLDMRTDHAARPDECIFGHLRTGVYSRQIRDQTGHGTTPLPLEEGISRRRVCQDDRKGRILSEYHRLYHPNFDEIPFHLVENDPSARQQFAQRQPWLFSRLRREE